MRTIPTSLQGLGFYKNKLIAFSLGNFIFDQDFLSTFGSVMLRTVWEGSTMIEARLVPVEIESYMPRFTAGVAAQNDLLLLNERSQLQARTSRVVGRLRPGALARRDRRRRAGITRLRAWHGEGGPRCAGRRSAVAHHRRERDGGGRSAGALPGRSRHDERRTSSLAATCSAGAASSQSLSGQAVGRTHWDIGSCDKDVVSNGGATGIGYLRLRRESGDKDVLLARPIARIPLFHHRFLR